MANRTPTAALCEAAALTPSERLILHAILAKLEGGRVDAYNTEIARWTGYDVRTVERLIPRLVSAGWILRSERAHPRPPVYQPGPALAAAELDDDDDGGGEQGGGGNVLPFKPRGPAAPPRGPGRTTAPALVARDVRGRSASRQSIISGESFTGTDAPAPLPAESDPALTAPAAAACLDVFAGAVLEGFRLAHRDAGRSGAGLYGREDRQAGTLDELRAVWLEYIEEEGLARAPDVLVEEVRAGHLQWIRTHKGLRTRGWPMWAALKDARAIVGYAKEARERAQRAAVAERATAAPPSSSSAPTVDVADGAAAVLAAVGGGRR